MQYANLRWVLVIGRRWTSDQSSYASCRWPLRTYGKGTMGQLGRVLAGIASPSDFRFL